MKRTKKGVLFSGKYLLSLIFAPTVIIHVEFMASYLRHYFFSLAVVGIIWYLSFFTPPKTELDDVPNIDKLAHTAMYGGLCCVIWVEYLLRHTTLCWKKLIVGNLMVPIFMSGVIELLQAYCTSGRSGDWWDFAANSLGVLLAWCMGYWVLRPLFWKHRP